MSHDKKNSLIKKTKKFLTSLFTWTYRRKGEEMQKSAILSNPSYIKFFYTLHSIGSFTFCEKMKKQHRKCCDTQSAYPIRENWEMRIENEQQRDIVPVCVRNFCFSTEKRSIWNVLFLFQLKFYILGVHKYSEWLCTGNLFFPFLKNFYFTAFLIFCVKKV